MSHALLRVIASTPINRQAGLVASQRHCVSEDVAIGRDELIVLLDRLQRKQRLLKFILRIKTPAQLTNTVSRHKAGIRSNFRPQRTIEELIRNGANIHNLSVRSSELGKILRAESQRMETAWRTTHPGCVWDRVACCLVAPDGAIFRPVFKPR